MNFFRKKEYKNVFPWYLVFTFVINKSVYQYSVGVSDGKDAIDEGRILDYKQELMRRYANSDLRIDDIDEQFISALTIKKIVDTWK